MNIQQGLPLKDLTTIGFNLYTYFELEGNSFENKGDRIEHIGKHNRKMKGGIRQQRGTH